MLHRITVDPLVMSGRPCIRGMRVMVANILRLLAARHDAKRILKAYPYLESEDIDACLKFAALLVSDRGGCVTFLVDMNLSPEWVGLLENSGLTPFASRALGG